MLSRFVCINQKFWLYCDFVDGIYTVKEKTLSCPGVSTYQPISDQRFKCYKKDKYIIQFDSGDRLVTLIWLHTSIVLLCVTLWYIYIQFEISALQTEIISYVFDNQ